MEKKDESNGRPKGEQVLSEKQERLLVSYLDGECSVLGKFWAERLLKANAAARSFVEEMEQTLRRVKEHWPAEQEVLNGRHEVPSFWDRVAARIRQEEQTELLLGRRSFKLSLLERPVLSALWEPLKWSFSGAVVTAVLAFVVFRFSNMPPGGTVLEPFRPGLFKAADVREGFSEAGFRTDPRTEPGTVQPLPSGRMPPRVFEVEWMKSRGRVNVIQDSNQSAAILWVNRNRALRLAEGVQLAPQGEADKKIVDLTPRVEGKEPIRILEDNLPTAYSAFDDRN